MKITNMIACASHTHFHIFHLNHGYTVDCSHNPFPSRFTGMKLKDNFFQLHNKNLMIKNFTYDCCCSAFHVNWIKTVGFGSDEEQRQVL